MSRPSTSVWLVKALLKTWKWLLRRALQRQACGLPFHRVAAVFGKLGHTQGLRLNPVDQVMGVSHTLRLDLTSSGDVECSVYQPNSILEGSKEPAILHEFSAWDVMDRFLCRKMSISPVSAEFLCSPHCVRRSTTPGMW